MMAWYLKNFFLLPSTYLSLLEQVVLTNGFSRVVLAVLMRAHSCNKRFRVVVAESRPDSVGYATSAAFCLHTS